MFSNSYNDTYEDSIYLRSLYPKKFYPVIAVISDFCDRLEYADSSIYDEAPDKNRIRRYAKKLHQNDMVISLDMVEVLLIYEIMHRRIRRRAFA